jgi:hypothetical protein
MELMREPDATIRDLNRLYLLALNTMRRQPTDNSRYYAYETIAEDLQSGMMQIARNVNPDRVVEDLGDGFLRLSEETGERPVAKLFAAWAGQTAAAGLVPVA